MSVPIYVDEYSGDGANQCPRSFTLNEDLHDIAAVLEQWSEPSGVPFRIQTVEGKICLIRYDGDADEWTLLSGFDGEALSITVRDTRTFDSHLGHKMPRWILAPYAPNSGSHGLILFRRFQIGEPCGFTPINFGLPCLEYLVKIDEFLEGVQKRV
jgi:hypothetical protein